MKFRKDKKSQAAIDRLPPHAMEAEQAVLGSVLLDPVIALGKCADAFKSAAVFYDLRHQTIYQAFLDMQERQSPIEIGTLIQELKDKKLLEEVGGVAYVAGLPDRIASAEAADAYIQIVKDKFVLRGMIRACTNAVSSIYQYEGNVSSIIDTVERDILRVRQESVVARQSSAKELVDKAIQLIDDMHSRKGEMTGIPSGFHDLDRMTWGFHPGDMVVIAARPSIGKTSLSMNIVEKVAVDCKIPVGVFSLEMTGTQLITRMICSRGRINMKNLRDGFLAERDFPKLTGAAGKIRNAPIYIDDSSGISIQQLRSKARRMWQEHGIQLLVIDYLQLLNNSTERRREDSRQQEVSDISSGIKALAKELSVPIIVLSQLNRDIERDKNRRPKLSDLRESGALEQDADFVGMLYKPAKADEDEDSDKEAIPVTLVVAKQRSGPTGDVDLTFIKSYTRFESAAKISGEDEPDDRQEDMSYRGNPDP